MYYSLWYNPPTMLPATVDLIIRLHLSVGAFNTCTAPTGMLETATEGFKIVTFILLFTYYDLNYASTHCLI